MDPVSQALVGANVAQLGQPNQAHKTSFKVVLFLGVLSGMAPDLDIFIRSSQDPLLALEFHRQFTHSLLFAPIGGLICAIALYLFVRRFISFKQAYWYCFLGYLSHGLLDACTAFGTMLFWPFSDMRIGWNNVSIIDPLFTLPLMGFVLVSVIKKRKKIAVYGFAYAILYLGLGCFQNYRVKQQIVQIAEQRGHQPQRINTFPTFANLLVWRTIYAHDGRYYVDAVRAGVDFSIYTGSSVEQLNMTKHFNYLDSQSQQYKDIQRFNWFTQGYSGINTEANQNNVLDLRYGLYPNGVEGFWRLSVSENRSHQAHADFERDSSREERMKSGISILWSMMTDHYNPH